MIIPVNETTRIKSYDYGWVLEYKHTEPNKGTKERDPWSKGNKTYHNTPAAALRYSFDKEIKDISDETKLADMIVKMSEIFQQHEKAYNTMFENKTNPNVTEFMKLIADILCNRVDVSKKNKEKLKELTRG